jgi:hypothetical protein
MVRSSLSKFPHVPQGVDYVALSGDVVYAEALGKPMLILNSFSVIHELLEKRASNFSHRPVFPVVELYVPPPPPLFPVSPTYKLFFVVR